MSKKIKILSIISFIISAIMMLSGLRILFLTSFIFIFLGIVFNVLSKKDIKSEYLGPKIISFLFPIVGLIIYAVNVGKNDRLANDAVLFSIVGGIVFSIAAIFIFI